MNLLIVGASRGIGLRLLEQALAEGHNVTALARHPAPVAEGKGHLRSVQGSVLDAATVESAVAGQDAVVCVTGVKTPWEERKLFSAGTRCLLDAMAKSGVRRLVCVTGIGAGDSRGHGGLLYNYVLFPLLARGIYTDKDRQEALVRASDTDWTIVRPGFLTNGPRTGSYRVFTDLEGVTAGKVSRADVADFVLSEITLNRYLGQTPLLTY